VDLGLRYNIIAIGLHVMHLNVTVMSGDLKMLKGVDDTFK